ncbi:GIY-YIG nuclease family protein [Paenibacillus planticolens]|uniref:GIY-YIG domain-containing protein n=1 Tax=Paenibacillus planticolens TaxID=2654976 RepID=A0ABX1ZI48_9BACL|nr:GIY-YIG nuclease family protein [Paenibacillus planticolens]NOU98428.1 hypothetical protein [Paenibacillus planticolens]
MAIDVQLPKFNIILFVKPVSNDRCDYENTNAYRKRHDFTLDLLARKGGVYFLLDDSGLLYIGRSNNIRHRISEHLRGQSVTIKKHRCRITRIAVIYEEEQYKQEIYESYAIRRFVPKYNADKKDGGAVGA